MLFEGLGANLDFGLNSLFLGEILNFSGIIFVSTIGGVLIYK